MNGAPARGPGTAASVVMTIGATLFVGAFGAQVPSAPYLALGLVAVVGLMTALVGLVLWWGRR